MSDARTITERRAEVLAHTPHEWMTDDGGQTTCPDCDAIRCNDCARVAFYVEREGWYFHAEQPDRGCFLIAAEVTA